jgi:crotonobetainyl-CoA:carnitine CoA-transferase CaiB-like acyl-CoA transferase
MSGPLSHLSVLELAEGFAATYCGKLLATYGARVIKVERPTTGDPTRSLGPFVNEGGIEASVPFLWLNMGKESVACDIEASAGQDIVRGLAQAADVVIESFTPGRLDGTAISYEALSAAQPRVVMTSVTPFGQTGPYSRYAGDEIVSYATGGGMYLTGNPDREPLAAGVPVASYTAGMVAFVGTLSAVFAARSTGRGDHVDVSIQEAMLDNLEIALVEHLHTGRVARRTGDRHNLVPWRLFPCRDGWAAVIGGPIRKWLGAIDLFEEPRLAEEKFRHVAGRIEHRDELEALIQPWLDRHDRDDILAAGRERGLAFGVLKEPEEVLEDPQHRARQFFQRVEHPVAGEQLVPGEPYRFVDAPARLRRAPLLGEHTAQVLLEDLRMGPSQLDQLAADGVIAVQAGAI